MKFRSFIAVPVDTGARRDLQRLSDGLRWRDKKSEIRWVPPENFHLTIAFIGDILQADAVRLETILSGSLEGVDAFELEIAELSYFPFNARPRLVAAMAGRNEALMQLHRKTQAALRKLGLPVESRTFVPHVTLGRVRHRRTPWLRIEPQALCCTLAVRELSLMRSDLDEAGARYTPVWTAGLSASSV